MDKWLPLPVEKRARSLRDIIEEYEVVKKIVQRKHLATRLKQMAEFERTKSPKKRHDPKIGERVMRLIELNRLKEGKQAAVKAYGPYVIADIDKDQRHAYIVNEFGGEKQESTRVRWEELVPIGDRTCTPIYAAQDVLQNLERREDIRGDREDKTPIEKKKKKTKQKND